MDDDSKTGILAAAVLVPVMIVCCAGGTFLAAAGGWAFFAAAVGGLTGWFTGFGGITTIALAVGAALLVWLVFRRRAFGDNTIEANEE